MFNRVLLLQGAIEATLILLEREDLNLSANEWSSLKELCLVLKPFEEVTVELSAENYVTLSKLIPMVSILKRQLASVMNEVTIFQIITCIRTIQQELSKRFDLIEDNAHCALSTYLDPRFKHLGFTNSDSAANIKLRIESKLQNIADRTPDNECEIVERVLPSTPSTSFWSSFDQLVQSQQSEPVNACSELSSYQNMNILGRHEDPLVFWKLHEKDFPHLAKLAKEYLCCCGSSVPSERIFSKAGTIDSDKRNRLLGDHVGLLIFLNVNAPLI